MAMSLSSPPVSEEELQRQRFARRVKGEFVELRSDPAEWDAYLADDHPPRPFASH